MTDDPFIYRTSEHGDLEPCGECGHEAPVEEYIRPSGPPVWLCEICANTRPVGKDREMMLHINRVANTMLDIITIRRANQKAGQ